MKRIATVILTALLVTTLCSVWISKCFDTEEEETIAPEVITIEQPQPKVVEVEIVPVEVKEEWHDRHSDLPLSDELKQYTESLCKMLNVDEDLAFAVMKSETGGEWIDGDWNGSEYLSTGFFQIRKVNQKRLLDDYAIDTTTEKGNIEGGVWMLWELSRKFSNNEDIIQAYKCGEYSEWVGSGITLDCTAKCLDYLYDYKERSDK